MAACKKIFHLALYLISILLISCGGGQSGPPPPASMTSDHLVEQVFIISVHQDTTVTTRQGIRIHIPFDAISAKGQTVTLLVKEALSLFDMLQAGLTTRADSRLLSSSGMFHLAFREDVTIKRAIKLSVPTWYADPAMQLYTGEMKDGRINWKDPESIQIKQTSRLQSAGEFFTQNCMSCHRIDRTVTGPALAWVDRRWKNKQHLYEFIRNNQKLLESDKSPYANCLFCTYNKTPMNMFSALSDSAITDLLTYINSEALRMGVSEKDVSSTTCDSCDDNALQYGRLLNMRNSLIRQNNAGKVTASVLQPVPSADTTGLPTKVSPPVGNAEYYEVEIKAVGWYNIDLLLNADKDFVDGRLSVQLTGNFSQTQNIYLIIPSLKIFAEGGLLKSGDKYGFYDQDGSIILPLGREAFIISLGEEKGNLFMGRHQLTLAANQELTIAVNKTTSEQIMQAFAFLKSDQVSIRIQPTKNADSIRIVDAQLSQMRQKLKGCACLTAAEEEGN